MSGDCDFLVYCVILYINIYIYEINHDIYRQSGQNQANTRSSVLKLKHHLRNACSGQENCPI